MADNEYREQGTVYGLGAPAAVAGPRAVARPCGGGRRNQESPT
jgi:hypothetical protein